MSAEWLITGQSLAIRASRYRPGHFLPLRGSGSSSLTAGWVRRCRRPKGPVLGTVPVRGQSPSNRVTSCSSRRSRTWCAGYTSNSWLPAPTLSRPTASVEPGTRWPSTGWGRSASSSTAPRLRLPVRRCAGMRRRQGRDSWPGQSGRVQSCRASGTSRSPLWFRASGPRLTACWPAALTA